MTEAVVSAVRRPKLQYTAFCSICSTQKVWSFIDSGGGLHPGHGGEDVHHRGPGHHLRPLRLGGLRTYPVPAAMNDAPAFRQGRCSLQFLVSCAPADRGSAPVRSAIRQVEVDQRLIGYPGAGGHLFEIIDDLSIQVDRHLFLQLLRIGILCGVFKAVFFSHRIVTSLKLAVI